MRVVRRRTLCLQIFVSKKLFSFQKETKRKRKKKIIKQRELFISGENIRWALSVRDRGENANNFVSSLQYIDNSRNKPFEV